MLRDFVYAFRQLRKTPIATGVLILALALGIGANASTFISINSIILHPFQYPNLDRVATVWQSIPKLKLDRAGVTPADFADFKARSISFDDLSAYQPWTVNITAGDHPEPVDAVRVTSGFFRIFGTRPKIGRTFSDENDRVAVLSEGLWKAGFGADPDIAGKTISLGGENYAIVGVMPDEFDFPLAAQVWIPFAFQGTEKAERVVHNSLAVGLLKAGVTADQANVEMQAIARGLAAQYPKTNADWSVSVLPIRQMAEETTNQFIKVIAVAALFLLFLAGANVANIQLARATNYKKTVAIQSALGASKLRLARSICAETVLLGLAGGAAGLLAATWVNNLELATIPALVFHLVPGIRHLRIDATVVLFTVALSLVTGILCSLPAIAHLLGRRSSVLGESLSQGARGIAGDSRKGIRNALVVCEVSLALLLLVSAGVMINTFQNMMGLNLGFNPNNLLTAQISLPRQNYDKQQARLFFDHLLPELSSIPGIKSASADSDLGQAVDFQIKDPPLPDASAPKPEIRLVDDAYFETMQLAVIRGRAITSQDRADSTPVIVVSRTIAEHYWPGSDPIGQQVHFGNSPWLTIVGISDDTKDWFTDRAQPAAYTPYRQYPALNMRLLLRTMREPALSASALVARVRSVDRSEPVYQVRTMTQMLDDQRSGVQAAARMMAANALIALFLAVTGIYGVISYLVGQRTREIGLRIALGAAKKDILSLTLGNACRVAGVGLLLGVPLTYALMRILSSVLFNVVVVKWTTFSGLTLMLAIAAILAAYLPARRATTVDPVIALRSE